MEAPLLLALARAQLKQHPAWTVDGVWISARALGLRWGRGRHSESWVFCLQPRPELWRLGSDHPACVALAAEAFTDQSKAWGAWVGGAHLRAVEGDPAERWLGLVFQRRAITGKLETVRLAYQAIPGRAGLRLDPLEGAGPRLGLGAPFPAAPPEPPPEAPPPLRRWRERFGEELDAALGGERSEVMEGEGDLLARHRAWSEARAQAAILDPRREAAERRLAQEAKRLDRLATALEQDRTRHQATAALKEPAARLAGELYRLKGAEGSVTLLDGTVLALPQGLAAEEAVQAWFQQGKKAERGLGRVAELEAELRRGQADLETARRALAEGGLPPAAQSKGKAKPGAKPTGKRMNDGQAAKRKDGKGAAFRSVQIEGFEILIGKGDAENDQLTFKVADNADYWLHVANLPGSHVVIRNPDKLSELPRAVLERAAELAAYHSKAKDGGKVEVHLCRVADVSKPRGFAPGKVMLKQWKSVRVYPKP